MPSQKRQPSRAPARRAEPAPREQPVSSTSVPRPTFRDCAMLVLLAVAVWGVYGWALQAPFVFDDHSSVMTNSSIVRLWPLFGDAAGPGPLNPAPDFCTTGRPLVNFSLALNYRWGGYSPLGYHVFNVVVHTLAVMLVWGIVRRTLRYEFFGGRFEEVADGLAFFTALLWAVHPLNTESVEYITQRTELLMALFYLATLYASQRYFAAASSSARASWCAMAVLACSAGMASKEVMVSAPLVVLLFERTFVTGSFRRAWQQSWPLYVGLAGTWILLATLSLGGPRAASAGFHLGVPVYAWWFTQAKILLMYLTLAVWPWPLVIHYDMPYLDTLAAAWPYVAAVAGLAIGTSVLFWRRTAAGFVGAAVFAILSPTLVVPIVTEMAAERRMYLPLAGLVALVLCGGYALVERLAQSRAAVSAEQSRDRTALVLATTIALAVATVASLTSVRRLLVYQDVLTLWEDTAAHQPDNAIVQNNLGLALYFEGRLQDAYDHFQLALALDPDNREAHKNLGMALGHLGRHAEAIEQYEQALGLNPRFATAHFELGRELLNAGRPQEAIGHFEEFLRQAPTYPEGLAYLSIALAAVGRADEALRTAAQATAVDPDNTVAHYAMGTALLAAGNRQDAMKHFLLAIEKNPDYAEARYSLALLLGDQKETAAAEQHLREALRVNPQFAEAHYVLAGQLAQRGELDGAAEHYLAAIALRPRYARALNNLGVVLMNQGKRESALGYFEEAVRQDPDYAEAKDNLLRARETFSQPQ